MLIDPRRIEVVDAEMAEVLRSKTGAERLAITWRMIASARRMIASHLRSEHPDWDDQQIHAETIRRQLNIIHPSSGLKIDIMIPGGHSV